MRNLDKRELLNKLIKVAETFKTEDDNYLISYPHFLKYFADLDEIKEHHLIIGMSFTYSWMPTILNFKTEKGNNLENNIKNVLELLNKVKKEKKTNILLSNTELAKVKELLNNSLVGTSKLLHFIAPEKYAIWDSKVFFNLYNEPAHKYKLEKTEAYLDYLQLLKELTFNEDLFPELFSIIRKKCPEITKFRALELSIFKLK